MAVGRMEADVQQRVLEWSKKFLEFLEGEEKLVSAGYSPHGHIRR